MNTTSALDRKQHAHVLQKWSARLAGILLVLHGLIELSGIFMPDNFAENLQFFHGMDPSQIAANSISIVLIGAMWGIIRLVAACGIWANKRWAAALGIAMSAATLVTALSVIPAGVVDTFLTAPVLALLLYTWFGRENLDSNSKNGN
jgi:hypothetical protein